MKPLNMELNFYVILVSYGHADFDCFLHQSVVILCAVGKGFKWRLLVEKYFLLRWKKFALASFFFSFL